MRSRVVLLLAIVLAMLAPAAAQAESGTAMLTIHYRMCPRGYAPELFHQICFNHPVSGGGLGIVTPTYVPEQRKTADENGDIVFTLPPGDWVIDGPPGEFLAGRYQLCYPADDPGNVLPTRIPLRAGDRVVCEYYIVPDAPHTGGPFIPDERFSPLTVFAITCDVDPGLVVDPGAVNFPPVGCRPEPGVTLTVTRSDAYPVGACTSGPDGLCIVSVPLSKLILSEELATVRDGYAPIANPVLLRGTQAPPGMVNIRAEAFTRPTGSASLTIHSRVCPLLYTGTDYFDDCHGTAPDYDQTLFVIGERGGMDAWSARIDGEGNAVFAGLGAERYTIVPALPTLTATMVAFCSRASSPGIEYPSSTVWWQTTVDLGGGEAILCDLYAIPGKQ
jgi:hypothetical protein